jgi:hypothetical protein
MENIYFTSLIISFIFLIAKFIEMRFITKENKSLKIIIIDSFIVYFCVVIGYYIIKQFNLKALPLMEAPVFVDKPAF